MCVYVCVEMVEGKAKGESEQFSDFRQGEGYN